MADTPELKSPPPAQNDTQTSRTLLADMQSNEQVSGIWNHSLARQGYALAEGISLMPRGMMMSVQDIYQDPSRLINSAIGGAVFGVGMRMLGPEANIARIASGVMGYMMLRDVAKPVKEAWEAAGDAKTWGQIHTAANTLGDGLGNFGTDTLIGLGTGFAGSGLTGLALRGTASGRNFESWRDASYDKMFGRTSANKTEFFDTKVPGAKSDIATPDQWLADLGKVKPDRSFAGTAGRDRTVDTTTGASSKDEIAKLVEARRQLEERRANQKVHRNLTQIVTDLLEKKAQPSAEPQIITPPDMPTFKPAPHDTPPFEIHEFVRQDRPATGFTDNTSRAVGDLAVAARGIIHEVDENAQAIAKFKEQNNAAFMGAVATGPSIPEVYFPNTSRLIALNGEVSTVEQAQDVGAILDHYAGAHAQAIEDTQTIRNLNTFSHEIHELFPRYLKDHGIPANELLDHEAPMFVIYNVDSPYTIPPIDMRGPTGEAVPLTSAGVVAYPRQFEALDSTHVSGVYEHEIGGHNEAYRRLFRLPADLRDKVLTEDVVGAALKKNGFNPDEEINVPIVKNPKPQGAADELAATGTDAQAAARGPRRGADDEPDVTMKKMTLSQFIVNVLNKQANENTSDIVAELIDPNTGYSLADLLSTLRPPAKGNPNGPGLLETRSIYGSRTADAAAGDEVGVEVHGMDAWRLQGAATALRWQAEHGGSVTDAATTKKMLALADKYETLSKNMAVPGDNYIWANTDAPGQRVEIPRKVLDSIWPDLFKAQMETPMPKSLAGKSIAEVVPPMGPTFAKIDALAQRMVAAVRDGKTSLEGFDWKQYPIHQVYSAGRQAAIEASEANPAAGQPGHLDPAEILRRVGVLSKDMRKDYPLPEPVAAKLSAQPGAGQIEAGAMPRPQGELSTAAPPAERTSQVTPSSPDKGIVGKVWEGTRDFVVRSANSYYRNAPYFAAPYAGGQMANWLQNMSDDMTFTQNLEDLMLRNQDYPPAS